MSSRGRRVRVDVSQESALWDAKTCAPRVGLRNPRSFKRFAARSATLMSGYRKVGRNDCWISDYVLAFIQEPDIAPVGRS